MRNASLHVFFIVLNHTEFSWLSMTCTHWQGNIIVLIKFSSITVPEVVLLTSCTWSCYRTTFDRVNQWWLTLLTFILMAWCKTALAMEILQPCTKLSIYASLILNKLHDCQLTSSKIPFIHTYNLSYLLLWVSGLELPVGFHTPSPLKPTTPCMPWYSAPHLPAHTAESTPGSHHNATGYSQAKHTVAADEIHQENVSLKACLIADK